MNLLISILVTLIISYTSCKTLKFIERFSPLYPSAKWIDLSNKISGDHIRDCIGGMGGGYTSNGQHLICFSGKPFAQSSSETYFVSSQISILDIPTFDTLSSIDHGSLIFSIKDNSVPSNPYFSGRTDAVSQIIIDSSTGNPHLFVYGGSDWTNNSPYSVVANFALLNIGISKFQLT
jgi:hypothetical protein